MTIYVVGVWYVTSYSSHCTLTDVRFAALTLLARHALLAFLSAFSLFALRASITRLAFLALYALLASHSARTHWALFTPDPLLSPGTFRAHRPHGIRGENRCSPASV